MNLLESEMINCSTIEFIVVDAIIDLEDVVGGLVA